MGVESQGAMPPRPEDGISVPEVPKSVTDNTLERQEAAGDPLKEAAIQRKNEIKKTFPEVPDTVVGWTEGRDQQRIDWEDHDPSLDERMHKEIATKDDERVQNKWDNFANKTPDRHE